MDMLSGQENDVSMCGTNSVCIDNVSITILQTFASFEAHGPWPSQA